MTVSLKFPCLMSLSLSLRPENAHVTLHVDFKGLGPSYRHVEEYWGGTEVLSLQTIYYAYRYNKL